MRIAVRKPVIIVKVLAPLQTFCSRGRRGCLARPHGVITMLGHIHWVPQWNCISLPLLLRASLIAPWVSRSSNVKFSSSLLIPRDGSQARRTNYTTAAENCAPHYGADCR